MVCGNWIKMRYGWLLERLFWWFVYFKIEFKNDWKYIRMSNVLFINLWRRGMGKFRKMY